MRQLGAFVSYLDNVGNPLVGRVRFFDTNQEPALVYNLDNGTNRYIEAGSIVFTNSSGQVEPQVFLADHDYIVVFEKYVGAGTMAEDDDTESWEEQGSAVDLYNTIGVSLTDSAMRIVQTVDELRHTQPLTDNEVVLLLGYSEPGDKPPIYYKFDPLSRDSDTGGNVISSRGSFYPGRWKFVECPRQLDVRHFGAFPKDSAAADSAQRWCVQLAGSYAHNNDCGLFFPATDTECNYDISGLTLYDVDCDDRARVFCVSGMSASITGIEQVFCKSNESANGNISLYNDVVRSSWSNGVGSVTLVPGLRLVIDGTLPHPMGNAPMYRDIEVVVESNFSSCVLVRCTVFSEGKIDGNITLRECVLKTSWFSSDYDFENDLTSDDNIILIDNCKDAQTYVLLKNMQEESNYGDLKEQTISNIELLPGCIVENGTFNYVRLGGSSELHNVSGSVSLVASSESEGKDHVWVDCWLDFSGHNNYAANFKILRGKIGLLDDEQLYTSGFFHAEDVSIELDVICMGHKLVCVDCVLISNVVHSTSSTSIVERVKGCTMQEGHLSIIAGTPGSIFNDAQWTDNVGIVSGPISIDRTNFDTVDSHHNYVYSGNSGTFLPSERSSVTTTLTITDDVTLKKNDNYVIVEEDILGDNAVTLAFYAESNIVNQWGIPGVKLFRVGTDDFVMGCDWYGTGALSVNVPLTFRMQMKKSGGADTYKACVPTMQMPGQVPVPLPSLVIGFVRSDQQASGSFTGVFTFHK